MTRIVIGSRGSQLALWQSRHIQARIHENSPDVQVEIKIIRTTGDKISESALGILGTEKGLFVKEIEESLLSGAVDLAVHSLKDVPTDLPEGLHLAAIPAREDPRDALVGDKSLESVQDLPEKARIGSSSLRRTLQLRGMRPDIQVEPIRGNVDTRIRKMREQKLDGIVLAMAGLKRMGLEQQAAYPFPVDEMIPAIGQGALAIETRQDDGRVEEILSHLDDPDTRHCTSAERTFLHAMGGGCQVPMGAHAYFAGERAHFIAFVADPEGSQLIRARFAGTREELQTLAIRAKNDLLDKGADRILDALDLRYER